jgi:multidrug efflux system membrane fusion protein
MSFVRRHRIAVGASALTLVLAFFWFRSGSSKEGQAPPQRPVSVAAEAARTGDISVYLDGIGTVTPLATVTVRARVDGELVAIHFKEGQLVDEGQLLFELDPRPFEVAVAQAEGQLARDQAQLANARLDLVRFQDLIKSGVIPRQQIDTQAALVKQFEASLDVDKAQIDAARLNLTYSRITAPGTGRIGLRLVDKGNMIHATDPNGLAIITQLQPITVVFTLPEDHLPALQEKRRAGGDLAVEAYDREGTKRIADGTLLTVDNTIDPATGTVRLKAQFPNTDEALFPNQFVNARLELDVRKGATLVPETALQRGTQGTFVYVVKDDKTVETRPVTVGVTEGSEASIDQGVNPGEIVVTDGTEGLRPGSTVTIREKRPPAPAATKPS